MPVSRRDTRGVRSFTVPLFGIAVLIGFYCLVNDWPGLPALINQTLHHLHLPY